jgi:hypothetical protein
MAVLKDSDSLKLLKCMITQQPYAFLLIETAFWKTKIKPVQITS